LCEAFEENSRPSHPTFKPASLPDFQIGNVRGHGANHEHQARRHPASRRDGLLRSRDKNPPGWRQTPLVTPQGTIYGRKAIEQYSADNYLRWHCNNLVHTVDRLIAVRNDVTGRRRRFVDSPTVRELCETTPVLILSALASLDERLRRRRSGGDDYLTKPFAFAELLARVQDRLNYLHVNLTLCFKSVMRKG
jgi:hypothetical protein